MMIRLMMIMVKVVLIIKGLKKGKWVEEMILGIEVEVGIKKEMMKMIV